MGLSEILDELCSIEINKPLPEGVKLAYSGARVLPKGIKGVCLIGAPVLQIEFEDCIERYVLLRSAVNLGFSAEIVTAAGRRKEEHYQDELLRICSLKGEEATATFSESRGIQFDRGNKDFFEGIVEEYLKQYAAFQKVDY